jgi:hypothetical protein
MRVSAFNPRVRTLSAFDPRVRTLSGLRGLGCGQCQQRNSLAGLRGRLRGFRLGDDSTDIDVVTGLPCDDPRANCGPVSNPATFPISTVSVPISGTLTQPSYSNTIPLLSPQQQLAQQYYGTTNLMQLTPAQSAAVMAAAPASASGVPPLTAAQIQQLKNAQVSLPGTIGGISTSTLLIGAAGVLALAFALGGKR